MTHRPARPSATAASGWSPADALACAARHCRRAPANRRSATPGRCTWKGRLRGRCAPGSGWRSATLTAPADRRHRPRSGRYRHHAEYRRFPAAARRSASPLSGCAGSERGKTAFGRCCALRMRGATPSNVCLPIACKGYSRHPFPQVEWRRPQAAARLRRPSQGE